MAEQNERLLLHLKKLGPTPIGYVAAHIHVSPLIAAKKTRDNLTRAIRVLSDLRSKYKPSEIFLMKNLDIVLIGKDIPQEELGAACTAVQQVFLGSVQPEFTNIHGGEGEFFTVFDLALDHARFQAWAESVAGVAVVGGVAAAAAEPKEAVDLAMLSRIKEEIHRIDITPMLFNQPVYVTDDPARPSILFHEMYISVQVLEDMLCPGLSLSARRWLFTDLTQELDAVVLRVLAHGEERGRKRISLNVNLSSLASEKFVRFDAELPAEARQNTVLEINKTDLFENMRLYRELAPFLRNRGYRLLLDGLSFLNVGAVDFDGIECDFTKVFWSHDFESLDEKSQARIIAKMRRHEGPRFVLARCDTADSLRFARAAQIRLVQGRLADHMVKRHIPF